MYTTCDRLLTIWCGISLSSIDPTLRLTKNFGFPIGNSAEHYAGLRDRKVKGALRPDAIKEIDRHKPYKGGNPALWKLHKLYIVGKHRLLMTVSKDHLLVGERMGSGFLLKTSDLLFDGIFERKTNKDVQLGGEELSQEITRYSPRGARNL